MAINADGSLATVAYRGHPLSAFEVDGPRHIRHLYMKEANYRGEVIEAIWHPHTPHVFGIYTTGQLFKWSPYDDDVEEKSIGANRLIMSRDGNLLAAGDVKGVLRVYTTSSLSCIYEVAAQDTVLGLAFSPDLRRLYDLRGFYGNAWEPNVLLKYADMDTTGTNVSADVESISQHSNHLENVAKWVDPVTVIASSPLGRFYCTGTMKGTVRLHDTSQNAVDAIYQSQGILSIAQIEWSPDGQAICLADSGGKVSVISLKREPNSPAYVVSLKASVIIPGAPILQLLFRPDSSVILVHTKSKIQVVSATDCSLINTTSTDADKCKWIVHPLDDDLLIGFTPAMAHMYDWELNMKLTSTLDYTRSEEDAVEAVLVTQGKGHILVQLSASANNLKDSTFFNIASDEFSLLRLETQQKQGVISIKPTILPDAFSEIALALGFLPRNRLVFLSKSFEVCCWQIPATALQGGNGTQGLITPKVPFGPSMSSVRTVGAGNNRKSGLGTELFSLPGDWISRDCWVLSSLWNKESAFLCPRNGEVAVVRCSALA